MIRIAVTMCLMALLAPAGSARAQDDGPPRVLSAGPAPATQPEGPTTRPELPARFAHLKVDRDRRRVIVDCETIEPTHLLELVGTSPFTLEHESLLRVQARPSHIHLGLLLCGFVPGKPVGWDEKAQKFIPPSGDRVAVQVCLKDPKTGKEQTWPLEHWIAPADEHRPMPRLAWLFTGSRRIEQGIYYADDEGTVLSLATEKYPYAVLSRAGVFSDLEESLEFMSNKKTLPKAGTPCQMILLPPPDLRVRLDRFGKVTVEGRPVDPKQLARALAAHRRARDDAYVQLTVSPDAVKADVKALTDAIAKAGIKPDRVKRQAPTTQPDDQAAAFPAHDPRAAIDLLTGQWQQHRRTVEGVIANQRDLLVHLEDRRQLFARQYGELADFVRLATEQYRQVISDLRQDR